MFNSLEQGHIFANNERKQEIDRNGQAKDLWKKLILQVHPHFFYDVNAKNRIGDWQKKAEKITARLSEIYRNKKDSLGDDLEELRRLEQIIARRDCVAIIEGGNDDLDEFMGLRNDEEERLNQEVERRKIGGSEIASPEMTAENESDESFDVDDESENEDADNVSTEFSAGLAGIKLKDDLLSYVESLDGKEIDGAEFNAQVYVDSIEKVFSADLSINEVEPKSLREAIKEIRRIELARLGTEFTLGKINSYDELQAETEKEGDEILKSKARSLWNFLVVHQKNNPRDTDLDGKGSLGLFKEAGVKFSRVSYVNPGESEPGGINLDTGSRHGASIFEQDGKEDRLIIDHHSELTGNKTSGTQEAYEFLISMGLLKKTEQLDATVDFVTKIDNLTYPGMEKYFENSQKTLTGLERFVQFDSLLKFFRKKENRANPYRDLTREELEILKLIPNKKDKKIRDCVLEQKKAIANSKIGLQELEREGLIIESKKYGKIAINLGKKIPGGFVAAKAYGCDAFIIWSPDKNSFFMSTSVPIEEEFSQGSKIRQKMWIKSKNENIALTTTLSEIVKKLTDNQIEPSKLENILEKEKEYLKRLATAKS